MFNNAGEPHIQGLQKNPKYLKFLLFCIAFCFFFALNMSNDFSEYLELTFKGVPETANYELAFLFIIVAAGTYGLEMTLRYLKYKTLFGYIWWTNEKWGGIYIYVKINLTI